MMFGVSACYFGIVVVDQSYVNRNTLLLVCNNYIVNEVSQCITF